MGSGRAKNFYLSQSVIDQLEAQANREGISQSKMVENALLAYWLKTYKTTKFDTYEENRLGELTNAVNQLIQTDARLSASVQRVLAAHGLL